MTFTTITVRRLSAGAIYKLWFIGMAASLTPLGMVFGVMALFGFDTVAWRGSPVHGIGGLLGGAFVGVFIALPLTAFFGTASVVGLWLYSKFRPLSLTVKNMP
jgi:hypothetical protein